MAKYGPGDVAWWLTGGFSLLPDTSGIASEVEDVLVPSRPLGATFDESTPIGIRRATLSTSGWYEDDTARSNAALAEAGATTRVACLGVAGNTIGKEALCMAGAYSAKWKRGPTLDDLLMANADYTISGAVESGLILKTLAAVTSASDTESSSVDNTTAPRVQIPITSNSQANPSVVTTTVPHGFTTGQVVLIAGVSDSDADINGERTVTVISTTTFSVPVNASTSAGTGGTVVAASTVNGGAGYLQVTVNTLGGYTSVDYTIRDSADDASYANLLSFTVVTAARAAERVAVSGTIDRYTAGEWSWTGSGSSQTSTAMIALARL